VVINASGASRLTVLRPILLLAALIAASMAVAGTALAPIAQRQLRTEITKVNVDLIANIVRPGLFSEIEPGLTFHIRNRAGDGSLAGLVIDDQRDPAIAYTYIAEQAVVLEVPGRTLLVMRDGALQRLQRAEDALSIVKFEAYAFDLSDLTPQNSAPVYKPSERSTAELLAPDLTDDYTQKNIARFRSELHDRLSQPLLPLAFAVVAFLFLGDARTTRQGRGFAVAAAILGAAAVRGLHFVAVSRSGTAPGLAWLAYAIPAGTLAFGVGMVMLDRQFALPRPVERVFDAVSEGLQGLWERLGVLRRGRAG
jgi:lipopolysaccharide export system permease protein